MVSGTIVSNPSDADRIGVVSIGSGAYTSANYGAAIGEGAYTTAAYATAIGKESIAAQGSVAIGGLHCWATSSYSVVIGYGSRAEGGGTKGVSIGFQSHTTANRAVVIGDSCNDNGNDKSVILGYFGRTHGSRSILIGSST